MAIQIDTREKARAIERIVKYFDENNIKHFSSKLYVGDYMNLDYPRVVVDRKQNLGELAGNLFADSKRFLGEVRRAHEQGIHLIILCEHSDRVKTISDVGKWENPLLQKHSNAVTGRDLMERIYRLHIAYNVDFQFCSKAQTGKRIVELIGGTQCKNTTLSK